MQDSKGERLSYFAIGLRLAYININNKHVYML